jgi:hypothetical protein
MIQAHFSIQHMGQPFLEFSQSPAENQTIRYLAFAHVVTEFLVHLGIQGVTKALASGIAAKNAVKILFVPGQRTGCDAP